MSENTCVCCGNSIPEGTQACKVCAEISIEGVEHIKEAYVKGYENGMRAAEELEEKHLSECRQISEYEQENKALRRLLRMALPYIVKSCSACDCKMLSDECKARSNPNTCFKWKHYDEAIKLLGGK